MKADRTLARGYDIHAFSRTRKFTLASGYAARSASSAEAPWVAWKVPAAGWQSRRDQARRRAPGMGIPSPTKWEAHAFSRPRKFASLVISLGVEPQLRKVGRAPPVQDRRAQFADVP